MVSNVRSYALLGIEAVEIIIQVDLSRGLPSFLVVGLPDSAVKESRERVRSAITNSNYPFPKGKITVNLAPADVKKEGTTYDLPIALSILEAEGVLKSRFLKQYIVAGELDLEGNVLPIKGALSAAIKAKELNCEGLVIPEANASEAALIEGLKIVPVSTLKEAVDFFKSGKGKKKPRVSTKADSNYNVDMSEVIGQEHAKRAMLVAAAGAHNILMVGPPGAGKTMLAVRLPSILPPMSEREIVETTQIYSAAGLLKGGAVTLRPFRSPHHSISDVALIGGGSSIKPGEVSLSHNGVLFLDEFAEFKRSAIEALRQPLESGEITVSRASGSFTFPAKFILVAAMNPCPCGYYGFEDSSHYCNCSPSQIKKYRSKISGPIIDRIDIRISVRNVSPKEIKTGKRGLSSAQMRQRVVKAREIQKKRGKLNSQLSSKELEKFCKLESKAESLLIGALESGNLSMRSYTRILRLSRTIADLEGSEEILLPHVAEALSLRGGVLV